MIRTVRATRYVTPLREGGSLPAIVEADDLGLYVVKFRGAGQGRLALVAEVIAGEIGRLLGLPVPELVFAEVDEALGRNEPDSEIRELLRSSVGLNAAMDYLPGSLMFDPAVDRVAPDLAARIVWFDAFITNVDRTARNTNMLCWHKKLYLIDHGAALYFHHRWESIGPAAANPFPAIRDHVLLPRAQDIAGAAATLRPLLTPAAVAHVVGLIPEEWLPADRRPAYVDYFLRRLDAASVFVEEAIRARAALV